MADAPTAGFHHGVPFDEYRSWPAISQSDLKVIHAQSPAHWRHQQTHRKTSAAMNLGSLVDCILLEPKTFGERFAMAPTGPDGQTLAKRSAAAKAEWAEVEASGKIVVTSGDMEKAEAIKRSVLSHEIAAQIVRAKGKRQLSLLWTDPVTGQLLKGRTDLLLAGTGVYGMHGPTVVDLKVIRSGKGHPAQFGRYAADFGLDIQGAVYADGARTVFDVEFGFWLLTVESEEPYPVSVYRTNDTILSIGRAKYREAIRAYQACEESGDWPGYGDEVHDMELPRWAQNEGVCEEYGGDDE